MKDIMQILYIWPLPLPDNENCLFSEPITYGGSVAVMHTSESLPSMMIAVHVLLLYALLFATCHDADALLLCGCGL